jgi:hypothetical protein
MSFGDNLNLAKTSIGWSPMWCAHERTRSPESETNLQFKGFAGGVPQNTERTTVKPWVGIAR